VAGRQNALSQLLVKLTAPGIPDIYQGTELGDFSLVDPDNRRAVDFAMLRVMLGEPAGPSPDLSQDKLRLLAAGLAARRERADLFAKGEYLPLEIRGAGRANLVAYARTRDGDAAIVLVPRLSAALVPEAGRWAETVIELPPGLAGRTYRDATRLA
jgi:(1->4)-alpha-D-glucan 1-alpha-D-glucosylmutase